jgi:hypothetical protein
MGLLGNVGRERSVGAKIQYRYLLQTGTSWFRCIGMSVAENQGGYRFTATFPIGIEHAQ